MAEDSRDDGSDAAKHKGFLKRLSVLFLPPLTQAQLDVLAQVKLPCC